MREVFDDDAARRALQALTDEPMPPVTTTLDQVLRRGKRRLLLHRAGSVAAVVAVVAAIGIGVMLMRPGDDSGGVRVGDNPVSVTVPPSDFPALPGWTPVDLPVTSDGSCAPATQEMGRGNVTLPSKQQIETAFVGAVESTIDTTSLPLVWKTYESPRALVVVEVGVGNGDGQVQLEIVTYGGTPEEAADDAITMDVPCLRPYRRILADGTVLQLHQADRSDAKGPTQKLRVYRPDGFLYTITSAGSGRGELPTTDMQLATTAEEVVKRMEE